MYKLWEMACSADHGPHIIACTHDRVPAPGLASTAHLLLVFPHREQKCPSLKYSHYTFLIPSTAARGFLSNPKPTLLPHAIRIATAYVQLMEHNLTMTTYTTEVYIYVHTYIHDNVSTTTDERTTCLSCFMKSYAFDIHENGVQDPQSSKLAKRRSTSDFHTCYWLLQICTSQAGWSCYRLTRTFVAS